MDDAGKAIVVVILIVVVLAVIAGSRGRSRGGKSNQSAPATSRPAVRKTVPAPPVDTTPTAQEQIKHVEEAEDTAVKLRQAIDTLDDVCREAVNTQRALLRANLNKKPNGDAPKEVKEP